MKNLAMLTWTDAAIIETTNAMSALADSLSAALKVTKVESPIRPGRTNDPISDEISMAVHLSELLSISFFGGSRDHVNTGLAAGVAGIGSAALSDLDALKTERDNLLTEKAALIKERDEFKAQAESAALRYSRQLASKLVHLGIRETAVNNGDAQFRNATAKDEPKTPEQRLYEHHGVTSMEELSAVRKAAKNQNQTH
jgi:hypothetical protein